MTLGARWTSLLLVGLGSTALLTACSDQPLEPVVVEPGGGCLVAPAVWLIALLKWLIAALKKLVGIP